MAKYQVTLYFEAAAAYDVEAVDEANAIADALELNSMESEAELAEHLNLNFTDADVEEDEVEDEGNAAFIVKPCNAHEELLAACLDMTNLLQATIVKYVGNGTILTDAEWNQVGQARAAIAKAILQAP